MTTGRDREDLIEAVTSAWRPRDPQGRIEDHPAWHDLDEAGRREAFEATLAARALEAALDPDGLTSGEGEAGPGDKGERPESTIPAAPMARAVPRPAQSEAGAGATAAPLSSWRSSKLARALSRRAAAS